MLIKKHELFMGPEWARDGHSAQMKTPQSLERGV